MIFEALKAQLGPSLFPVTACAAGHSVGEYAALVAAGALPFQHALLCVQARSQSMQKSIPSEPATGMYAILGLDSSQVQNLIQTFFEEQPLRCSLANDNSPGQVIVTGQEDDLTFFAQKAIEKGAVKALKLPVSGPFHSPWMIPASKLLDDFLQSYTFSDTLFPVISNVTAQPLTQGLQLKSLLPQQVYSAVLWKQSVETMAAMGVTKWLELGSGKVLTGLIKRCLKKESEDSSILSLQETNDFEKVKDLF
jgi:[acyl-carrier-protein] S-malonyltransferase